MQISTLASLAASSIFPFPSPLPPHQPLPAPLVVGACIEIAPGASASLPLPDPLRIGYYSCATTSNSPQRSDIITIGKHILMDGYLAPHVPPGKQCGELEIAGSAVFYICGEYPTGGEDDGVAAGVTSILGHCEMGGRAEGVFRVSEEGVLVITSAVGGLVVDGELKNDF